MLNATGTDIGSTGTASTFLILPPSRPSHGAIHVDPQRWMQRSKEQPPKSFVASVDYANKVTSPLKVGLLVKNGRDHVTSLPVMGFEEHPDDELTLQLPPELSGVSAS
jgi:hypothetical protein